MSDTIPRHLNGSEGSDESSKLMLPGDLDPSQGVKMKGEGGNASDEELENPMTFRKAMVIVGMAFLWTASQIPLYFFGGAENKVLESIGGVKVQVWVALGNLIPLAIITPFVGTLSDMFGRKYVGLSAFLFIIVGNIICGVAASMAVFLPGIILQGIGAGIGELTSLAVAGEIAPTKYRGLYVGGMIITILPFCPAVLYAELLSYHASWRYMAVLVGGWSLIGAIITFVFYWPPPRNMGVSRAELVRRVDWVGGALSAAGLTLFLVGLVLPTENIRWKSPVVVSFIIIGALLIVGFFVWEVRFVEYPMFPHRLFEKNPRVLTIVLVITFVSGANFFAALVFWPTQYQNLYAANTALSQGIGALPVGFGIIGGSVIVTVLVSVLKGKIKLLLIVSALVMTAGNGALAAARLDNLPVVWFIVSMACIGVGAVIVPNQVIAGIVVPDDLLATVTAAAIAVRVIGGCIAYAIYYDLFIMYYDRAAKAFVVPVLFQFGIKETSIIEDIVLTLQIGSFYQEAAKFGFTNAADIGKIVYAGKEALVRAYPPIYYVSIAFGGIAIIASFFLTGIEEQMTSGAAVRLA